MLELKATFFSQPTVLILATSQTCSFKRRGEVEIVICISLASSADNIQYSWFGGVLFLQRSYQKFNNNFVFYNT